jgi:hypothetical protein
MRGFFRRCFVFFGTFCRFLQLGLDKLDERVGGLLFLDEKVAPSPLILTQFDLCDLSELGMMQAVTQQLAFPIELDRS